MQKIILFIEHTGRADMPPANIGNMFINRFAIDETASSEILGLFEFVKTSRDISWTLGKNYEDLIEERQQKGMAHFIVKKYTLYYSIYSSCIIEYIN